MVSFAATSAVAPRFPPLVLPELGSALGTVASVGLRALVGVIGFALTTTDLNSNEPTVSIYRAVSFQELASIQASGGYSPSPSGFGEKQFWLNYQNAEDYMNRPANRGIYDAIVTSQISPETLNMGVMINEPRIGEFVSFPNSAIPVINREAQESGGIRRLK